MFITKNFLNAHCQFSKLLSLRVHLRWVGLLRAWVVREEGRGSGRLVRLLLGGVVSSGGPGLPVGQRSFWEGVRVTMASQGPVLIGIEGYVEGEEFPLQYGETAILGRSRSCDISLRKCKKWLDLGQDRRDIEKDFNTVSRKHARISFYNVGSIEIEDLSSNGTFVDGKRVDRIVITDIRERSHEVQLGTRERFRLEWRPDNR